jgi:hypothetical protein
MSNITTCKIKNKILRKIYIMDYRLTKNDPKRINMQHTINNIKSSDQLPRYVLYKDIETSTHYKCTDSDEFRFIRNKKKPGVDASTQTLDSIGPIPYPIISSNLRNKLLYHENMFLKIDADKEHITRIVGIMLAKSRHSINYGISMDYNLLKNYMRKYNISHLLDLVAIVYNLFPIHVEKYARLYDPIVIIEKYIIYSMPENLVTSPVQNPYYSQDVKTDAFTSLYIKSTI